MPPKASTSYLPSFSGPDSGSLTPSQADTFSYADVPKPFKNPNYKRSTTTKRTKNLKQIIAGERERGEKVGRERRERMELDGGVGVGVGVNGEGEGQGEEGEKVEVMDEDKVASYTSVEAAPSILPSKKYCDITGLESSYLDPKSTLRYHNAEVYEIIKSFQPSVIQTYLGVRGMGVMLR